MTQPGENRPEPVTVAAKIAAGVSGVVALLITLGFLTVGQGDQVNQALAAIMVGVTGVVSVVSTITAAFKARQHVTPLADPRTSDGTPLVPM